MSKSTDWKSWIEVVSVGPDSPDDYDLCVQNNHPSIPIIVTVKVVYSFGDETKELVLEPKERIVVCTVDFGPVINNCEQIQLLTANRYDQEPPTH